MPPTENPQQPQDSSPSNTSSNVPPATTNQPTADPGAGTPLRETGEDNAFNSLGNSVLGADNMKTVENANLPNKFAQASQIKTLLSIPVILIGGSVFTYVVYNTKHQMVPALVVAGITLLVCIIVFLYSFITFRNLKKSDDNPAKFNHFQTDTAANYVSGVSGTTVANVSESETIVGWFGPVSSKGDKMFYDYGFLGKEQNNSAVNTLLFTNKQIIAIMLGPQDVPSELSGGILNKLASTTVAYSSETSYEKGIQFEALYVKKWDKIMSALLAQPLASILQNHFNFALSYDQIGSVKPKRTFINPGISVILKDGRKITYATFAKDHLDDVKRYLQPYVQIEE